MFQELPHVETGPTDLIKSISIENLLSQRVALLERYSQMQQLAEEIKQLSATLGYDYPPCFEWEYSGRRHPMTNHYSQEQNESVSLYQRTIDGLMWQLLMEKSGNLSFMDAKAREAWRDGLKKDVPEFTPANIKATFQRLHESREEMFNRGVLNVFKGLSWDYKTNLPFKFGKRIVVSYLSNSYSSTGSDKIDDLIRTFCILDGQPTPEHRQGFYFLMQDAKKEGKTQVETPYFNIKWYRNGNGHISFKRMDLVERMNKIVSLHFPFHIPQDNKKAA